MEAIQIDKWQELAISWGTKAIFAILILIIGHWLAKFIARMVIRAMEKQGVDVTLTRFFRAVIYYVLLVAVVVAAAGSLGVNTGSFLAILGTMGLAIGLALKDSLGNFASGVMLILLRPFKVGDWVTVGGQSGSVEEISMFATVVNTGDNQRIIVPNGMVASDVIVNTNANETRRIDLLIGIGYGADIGEAKAVLNRIISEEERVLADPAPQIAVSDLADSSVNLVVRPWVKPADYWAVRFELTEKIKQRLDAAGISIPFPQRDVHVYRADDAAAAAESVS
ncbi:MAG: mechanosensitive ion channel [Desulfofustis sp. PB-SRB1]|jgi:small conductance mechanosensitive channel|nr:mechanosensitive ion channel [Desulfofustis sp. PB-SRB1]MBM1003014.1 mechanosensitive ion channel [Desulfofustis sp. PB-SRB1]HBH28593.1 mechanosensitive ion channel protein MscS [Desulfofustis sp.]